MLWCEMSYYVYEYHHQFHRNDEYNKNDEDDYSFDIDEIKREFNIELDAGEENATE